MLSSPCYSVGLVADVGSVNGDAVYFTSLDVRFDVHAECSYASQACPAGVACHACPAGVAPALVSVLTFMSLFPQESFKVGVRILGSNPNAHSTRGSASLGIRLHLHRVLLRRHCYSRTIAGAVPGAKWLILGGEGLRWGRRITACGHKVIPGCYLVPTIRCGLLWGSAPSSFLRRRSPTVLRWA